MGDLNFRLNPLNVGEDEWNYIVNFVKCNENNTHPQRFEPLLIHDQVNINVIFFFCLIWIFLDSLC